MALLLMLRAEAGTVESSIQRALVNRVRWQLLARVVGQAVAGLAGAVADGLALVTGLQSERKEKR
jgi:ATP-dependent protease HslVU (ClpYQ) peptidase subunit